MAGEDDQKNFGEGVTGLPTDRMDETDKTDKTDKMNEISPSTDKTDPQADPKTDRKTGQKMGFSIKHKLVLLLLALVFTSIISTLVMMTMDFRAKLREESERHAVTIASMVSRLSGLSKEVVLEVESIVDSQILAQTNIAAHMVAVAEKAGESPEQIISRLKDIVQETDVDEFWITDSKGKAYLTNIGVEFSFSPDPKLQPQAHIFYKLLDGKTKSVTQRARVREIDNSMFKYVASRGVDKPRIVQIGYDFEFMKGLVDRVGLKRFVDRTLKERHIDSIWVF